MRMASAVRIFYFQEEEIMSFEKETDKICPSCGIRNLWRSEKGVEYCKFCDEELYQQLRYEYRIERAENLGNKIVADKTANCIKGMEK